MKPSEFSSETKSNQVKPSQSERNHMKPGGSKWDLVEPSESKQSQVKPSDTVDRDRGRSSEARLVQVKR